MAGIGEASAIIAVAQVGIKVSKTIFEFVGEVKDAPKEIRRIGRDICTTSERLEEIGRLIDNNNTSRFFNQGGIASAVRCSNDCKEIIDQVNGLLARGGWVSDSSTPEKKDLDISLLDQLRWPFVRTKLASPQADLEKVKASLSLLFNSVMATASSNPMQSEYALQIPKLKKWAEQATQRAENERRRSRQGTDSGGRVGPREVHWKDQQTDNEAEDAEMRQRFIEFQVRLVKEEEERKARDRAAYIQAEQEAKRKAENEAQKKIEQSAIDLYKKEQEEIRQHKSEKEQKFKEELSALGLESEKIQSIIDTTGFQELELESAKQTLSVTRVSQVPKIESNGTNGTNGLSEEPGASAIKAANISTGSSRPWMPRTFSRSRLPGSLPADDTIGNTHNTDEGQAFNSTQQLQLWLVDLVSGQNVELAPSHHWLRSKIDKARYDEIAHKMAKLKHPWRTAILDFLRSRNDREPPHVTWKLCFIGLPRRVSKLALFGHRRGDCLVRLVLCQHKAAEENLASLPLWDDSALGNGEAPTSAKLLTNPSPRMASNKIGQKLRGALKHPAGSQYTDDRQYTDDLQVRKGEREVNFSQNLELETDLKADEVGAIRIEMETVGNDVRRATTTIDSSLFPPQALDEFGQPWRKLEQIIDGEMQEVVRIPKALNEDEIERLNRITMELILEGKVPWRKPPQWELRETFYDYFERTAQPSSSARSKVNRINVDSAMDVDGGRARPEASPADPTTTNDRLEKLEKLERLEKLEQREIDDSVEDLRSKRKFREQPIEQTNSRPTNDWGIVDVPPRTNEPLQAPPIVQEVVTHHRHIDHGYDRDIPIARRERGDIYDYERERPDYRDVDRTVVKRYTIPETLARRGSIRGDTNLDYKSGSYRDRDDEIIVREWDEPIIINNDAKQDRERSIREEFPIESSRPTRVFSPEDMRAREEILREERRRPLRPRYRDEEEIILRDRDGRRTGDTKLLYGDRDEEITIRERERERERPTDRPGLYGDRDEEFTIRARERERIRPREREIVHEERRRPSRPRYRDEEEIIIQDPDGRLAWRPREREEIIIRERERSRPRGIDAFDIREEIRPRERADIDFISREDRSRPNPVSRFDSPPRGGPVVLRRRDSTRYEDYDIRRRETSVERPKIREIRDEQMFYGELEREREREYEEGRSRVEEIIIRRDSARDENFDRHAPIRPDLDREQREDARYGKNLEIITRPGPSRYRGRAEEAYPTPAPPVRLNTPGESYLNPRHTSDAAQTNEDIISNTLGELTTYNAIREEDVIKSPTGMEYSFPEDADASSYATNLKSAQEKLDELQQKLDKANKEGDFLTASDLQYYAIPDVKATVEELKARNTKIDGLERIEEVEDSDHVTTRSEEDYYYEKREPFDENGLQSPGSSSIGKKRPDSPAHSSRAEDVENPESSSRKEALQNGNIASDQGHDDDGLGHAVNGTSANEIIEEIRIVRRPTATPSVAQVEEIEEID